MKKQGSSVVRLGLLQHACAPDPKTNVAKTLQLAEKAARQGAQIICTQELFPSQYFCQSENHDYFKLAEPIPGPTTEKFQKFARKHGVVVIASLFEKRAAGLYHNTAAIIDADGSLMGIYRKMHIPDDPLYYEKFYFTPGDLGFRVWPTRFGKLGVLICWDQWYPEGARLTAMQGAEILFYPTAIGWHPAEKAEYGTNQHGGPGRSSSGAMRWPTAATWRRSTGSGSSSRSAVTASNSGGRASWRAPRDRSSPRRVWTVKR